MSINMLITLLKKEVKTLKIQEFIKDRNVKYSTVFQYIKRNRKMFDGHIGRASRIELDDYAIELLSKKYPKPEIIEVVEDTRTRDELVIVKEQLMAAQQIIIKLQQQAMESANKIAEAEAFRYLLDIEKSKTAENAAKLAESELKVERSEKVVAFLKDELEDNWEEGEELRNKINQLEKEIEALKNRSFLSRLRNDMPNIEVTENLYKEKLKNIMRRKCDSCIEQILKGENDEVD